MDIYEYTHLDDEIQDMLFESMLNTLNNELLSDESITLLAYGSFYNAGIKLNNNIFKYDIANQTINLNMSFNTYDINLDVLIDNLFSTLNIDSNEYEILKEAFIENPEQQSYLNIYYQNSDNISDLTVLFDSNNILPQYILEMSINSLVTDILNTLNNDVKREIEYMKINRIYVFRKYSELYDINSLINEVLNENN